MVEQFFTGLEQYAGNKTPVKQAAIETARGILLDAGVEVSPLSSRQQQIIQLIANGFGKEQIGERFRISERTVNTHLTNIFKKLGVHSQGELMIAGVKRGIIDLDEAAKGRNLKLAGNLTDRETDVLKTMIEQQTTDNGEIAKALTTKTEKSPRTIETHRANLLPKLEVSATDQALIIYMAAEKQGIISKAKEKKVLEKASARKELTQRQKSTFQLLTKGLSNEEIAQQLGDISPRTVSTHRSFLFKKLGVHTLGEMVIVGVNKGLIDIKECVSEDMKPKLNDLMHLLPNEKEVLETMIELQRTSHKVIGTSMSISSRTVDTHVHNLMDKLDLHAIDRVLMLYMFHQKTQTNPQTAL